MWLVWTVRAGHKEFEDSPHVRWKIEITVLNLISGPTRNMDLVPLVHLEILQSQIRLKVSENVSFTEIMAKLSPVIIKIVWLQDYFVNDTILDSEM